MRRFLSWTLRNGQLLAIPVRGDCDSIWSQQAYHHKNVSLPPVRTSVLNRIPSDLPTTCPQTIKLLQFRAGHTKNKDAQVKERPFIATDDQVTRKNKIGVRCKSRKSDGSRGIIHDTSSDLTRRSLKGRESASSFHIRERERSIFAEVLSDSTICEGEERRLPLKIKSRKFRPNQRDATSSVRQSDTIITMDDGNTLAKSGGNKGRDHLLSFSFF